MNESIKKINRNAFNEKLLQRYFFETMYLEKKYRKNLLPDYLKNKSNKLNLIVPENIIKDYRADFLLFFKKERKGYPVEIKWLAEELNKEQQIKRLKENKGFLVSFKKSDKISIPQIIIDKDHFKKWLLSRIDTLWNEAYSERIEYQEGDSKWLIVLKGSETRDNFRKMYERFGDEHAFWAFKNRSKIMDDLLRMKIGDELLFIMVQVLGGRTAIRKYHDFAFRINDFYSCKITNPYYMAQRGSRSIFFEKASTINDKRWPHFIDFKILEKRNKFNPEEQIIKSENIPSRLAETIAQSYNKGSIPSKITFEDAEFLKGQIRIISESYE